MKSEIHEIVETKFVQTTLCERRNRSFTKSWEHDRKRTPKLAQHERMALPVEGAAVDVAATE